MGLSVYRATGACDILCAVRVIRCRGKQWRHTYKKRILTAVPKKKKAELKTRVYTNPGSNYCRHIDGYDKIKPDGFAIHGRIDGYSRKAIWLGLDRTNNNSLVSGRYYMDAVKE